jgi:hypothetical protein
MHVIERAEGGHGGALEAHALDPAEHVAEVEVARSEMLLMAVAEAIRQANLDHAVEGNGCKEAFGALRHEMRVVGVVVVPPFFDPAPLE